MSPWFFVLGAIAANISLNICLKIVSTLIGPNVVPLTLLGRVLSHPAFWLAGISGLLLLGCFVLAIRSIPLSMSYATITGGAMAGLAVFSLLLGHEQFNLLRLAGLTLVIAGVAMMSQTG